MSALDRQVGGNHYSKLRIQPAEYITANGLGYLAGSVVKYATRYRDKGGAADLRKAIHCLELLLELEYPPVASGGGTAPAAPAGRAPDA